ncbi:hypothetical protein AMTRI_Chr13g121680 [Amborella trichopoda]
MPWDRFHGFTLRNFLKLWILYRFVHSNWFLLEINAVDVAGHVTTSFLGGRAWVDPQVPGQIILFLLTINYYITLSPTILFIGRFDGNGIVYSLLRTWDKKIWENIE